MKTIKQTFFETVFADSLKIHGGYIELRSFNPKVRQYFCTNICDVLQYTTKNELFFGVCPRSKRNGTATSIKYLTTFWIDVDDLTIPLEDRINAVPLPPSIVVSSGHGFHVYWLLSDPVQVDSRVAGILKGLQVATGSDPKSTDIPRILRVPGTFNLKCPVNPKKCEIQFLSPARRYALEDFKEFEREVIRSQEKTPMFNRGCKGILPPCAKKILNSTILPGSRANIVFSLSKMYRKNGYSQNETEQILLNFNAKNCKPSIREHEIRATVRSSYQHLYGSYGCEDVLASYCVPYCSVRNSRRWK
ncbi:MAG: DNA-primase RepB domain-containing protein [Candidatus Tantalella remota]|nr:DNA-primase RepB domain-containing protein [Candidatus Tantalella remota]